MIEIKEKIINKFIEILKKSLKEQENIFNKTEEVRKESSGAMQSWSDTTRNQKEREAGYYAKKMMELSEGIKYLISLKNTQEKDSEIVKLGSLVALENDKKYLLVKSVGGFKLNGDNNIFILSENAVLFKKLLGKKRGDEIEIGDFKFKILNII